MAAQRWTKVPGGSGFATMAARTPGPEPNPPVTTIDPLIAAAFIVYLAGMLAIGWAAYRRTADLSDYLLGGRRLGRWVAALSAGASDMSGWLLLGLPGYAYAAGLESVWLAGGLLAGTWLNWRLVAPRLRVTSERLDALTIPAFLELHFADRSRLLRSVSALFILLFFLFYTSSGLVAGGKLFETVFGLPYSWAVAAGALVIITYTLMGGFLAVSWTDLVQGLLMAAALVVVPLVAFGAVGEAGIGAAMHPALLDPLTDRAGEPLGLIVIISLAGWGLGYFGQPHILARFKAIRSVDHIPAARRIAVGWSALTLAGATLTGLAGAVYLETPLTGADTERVFMLLAEALFHPLVAGILLAAILAAVMSTADSQLLVASSALAEDFYDALLRRGSTGAERIRAGRLAVVGIALVACLLALDPDSRVLDLVAYAWAGFGAAFGPTLLLALYWPRMTRTGALAGIVVGGLTVVLWSHLHGGLFDLYELVPGFVASALAIIGVSLAGRPPTEAPLVPGRS